MCNVGATHGCLEDPCKNVLNLLATVAFTPKKQGRITRKWYPRRWVFRSRFRKPFRAVVWIVSASKKTPGTITTSPGISNTEHWAELLPHNVEILQCPTFRFVYSSQVSWRNNKGGLLLGISHHLPTAGDRVSPVFPPWRSIPSGNDCYIAKMAIEIVCFPIENGDFPQFCKRLPWGNPPR